MLTVLFISCSSDDNSDDGDKDKKGMIDESILGKWKVEYSKTIKGARFLEDGTLEIADGAIVTEYMGDYGKPDLKIESGMFDEAEIKIEVKDNNTILVFPSGKIDKTIEYKIEDGLLKRIDTSPGNTIIYPQYKYRLSNGILIIERIPTSEHKWMYSISEYSKITE